MIDLAPNMLAHVSSELAPFVRFNTSMGVFVVELFWNRKLFINKTYIH